MELVSASDNSKVKSNADLAKLFEKAGIQVSSHAISSLSPGLNRSAISMCGSGVNACGLIFALKLLGARDDQVSLYAGSWTEYARKKESQIEKA